MSLKIRSRTAQYPLLAEFTFDVAVNTMLDSTGALKDFKALGTAFVGDIIPLPPGAVVIAGEVVTDTAVTGATAYNISLGDSANATRYLGATDRVLAGRTAAVPTGYLGLGENLRLTVATTIAAATAGKVTVRISYVVTGRTSEIQIT